MRRVNKASQKTPEERAEIIAYVKEHGTAKVKQLFDVWPDTVKYWMNPDIRKTLAAKGKKRYAKIKDNPAYIEKNKQYSVERRESGITKAKYDDWLENKSDEYKQARANAIKQHRLDNIEHYKRRSKDKHIRERDAGVYRERYATDILYKLKCNIREHLRQAVKYGDTQFTRVATVEKNLGCTMEQFRQHIESKFLPGMSWDNNGRGADKWHLDHIIPLAAVKDISDTALINRICHYTNYQPLWEKDNLSKNDKYDPTTVTSILAENVSA